jgi:hypothetical protein
MVDSKFLQALLGCEVLYLCFSNNIVDQEREETYIKAYVTKASLNAAQDTIILLVTTPDGALSYHESIPLTVAGYTQRTTLFYLTEEDDSLVTTAEYLNSIWDDFKNGLAKV